jgi:hypothetical protein
MRQHTPLIHGEVRPLPFFPDVGGPTLPAAANDVEIDVDLSHIREPTPPFLLLDYRRTSALGASIDEAFEQADPAFLDEPSRTRKVVTLLVFSVVFGAILALFGYVMLTLVRGS